MVNIDVSTEAFTIDDLKWFYIAGTIDGQDKPENRSFAKRFAEYFCGVEDD